MNLTYLPTADEVCEGYVFTRVCHSVHRGGAWSREALDPGGAWSQGGVWSRGVPGARGFGPRWGAWSLGVPGPEEGLVLGGCLVPGDAWSQGVPGPVQGVPGPGGA